MRYRKKPLIIEAVQWFPDRDVPGVEFPVPAETLAALSAMGEKFDPLLCGAVRTLEGPFICWSGDYIITGIKGEVYPCKPDIFAETYEAVE